MSAHAAQSVTVVGHSLGAGLRLMFLCRWLTHHKGAAISLIDSIFLTLNLDPGTTIKYIGYGLPRVSFLLKYARDFIDEAFSGW